MNTVHPASGFKKKSVVSACSVLLKMQPGSAAEDVLGSSVITRCVCFNPEQCEYPSVYIVLLGWAELTLQGKCTV